jgi:hypothetical protein
LSWFVAFARSEDVTTRSVLLFQFMKLKRRKIVPDLRIKRKL